MKNKLNKETNRLSNYELNVLLPILMNGLEMKRGKANTVTSKQIVQGLRSEGLRINTTDVCKLINYIRTNDLVVGLVAWSAGYYISDSEQEIISYEKRLMSREAAIRKVRMSIQRQRRALFSKITQRHVQLF